MKTSKLSSTAASVSAASSGRSAPIDSRLDSWEIDTSAPVIAEGEILIEADMVKVWHIMRDVAGWPQWNPDIAEVQLDGEIAEGSTFQWKAGSGIIRSTMRVLDPPHRMAWTGSTMGIRAVHAWRLKSSGTGTIVATAESWNGLLPRLFRRRLSDFLHRSINSGLGYLKTEAESREAGER